MSSPAAGPRTLVSFLALALVVLMVPVAVVGTWLHSTVRDTDAFVERAGALLEDDSVRSSTATVLSNEIVSAVGGGSASSALEGLLSNERIPAAVKDRVRASADGVSAQLRETVAAVALQVMGTPRFKAAWVGANRALHEQLITDLESEVPLTSSDGMITLDLGRATAVLREELTASGFAGTAALPEIRGTFPLVAAEKLEPARRAYGVLDTWAPRALWIVLGGVLIGAAAANRRLSALSWTALLSGLALVACLPLTSLARSLLVDTVADGDLGTMVDSMATALTDPLASRLWLFGIGLVVLGAAARIGQTLTARTPR